MIKKYSLVVLFSLTISLISAQDFDFGKVSIQELNEKVHPLDSSASAAYLYKKRSSYFRYDNASGFELVTEVFERVKIYNKDGYDFATKPIRLYKASQGNRERVMGLKAITYNIVDGDIEETKLKKDGIFESELSEFYDQTKFTMPNIKDGSVIEYKYRINSPFIYNVDDYIFQHSIPANKIEASFSSPEYYNFKLNSKGYLGIYPKVTRVNSGITIKSKSREARGATVSTNFNSDKVDFFENKHIYNLVDIPALKEEPYINNIDNYRAAVKYELSSVQYPNSIPKYYSSTWKNVVKTIYDSPSFGVELNKTGYYNQDIDMLIASITDPMQKAGVIYQFVKSKVKWNGIYGKYTYNGVRKAYKESVGNVADINLMLTSMLRYAGLDAYPVLVSTRGNGIPIFPTREGYNYVVSAIKTDRGIVLLDATSIYNMPNVMPTRVLNWEGRIISKDGGSSTISLYPNEQSTKVIMMTSKLDENGVLSGAVRKVAKLHNARIYRNNYNEADEDSYIEKIEKALDLEISDFEVKNSTDLSKPILESYKFVKESQADVIGDKIYFSPMFFYRSKSNPFKLEKRSYPIDFSYPTETTYRIIVEIPAGYKVETLPEVKSIALPEQLGSFTFNVNQKNNQVHLLVKESINKAIVTPDYYAAVKNYFKLLIEKENEKVVLTKI
ncbi:MULTISPECIES: DUF3858 domain-containing protein [unclassified Cellulophaga]|uniref:DUF3858 domain-containing protein n=1 Tax=unclassified Cellulophaga TaxID=2634405 RepID=UPI0026E3A294|nr:MULTISPECIES: DUF3858 domain-containing protein [unclassified Cellulophaga]MDO6490401.1 DUF3858 domain-containing protein [Cellulophaga sp. 2_MG-2023]MDO6494405.1 DUF3858 domain-containing protein [Cellulophaga sp. 3_MG-2023]